MKLRASIIVLSQALAGFAAADTYPFAGFYALKTSGPEHAGCGFDILHQSESGAFSGYLFDTRHWEAQGQVRFLRYKTGTCTFDSATAIDNCVTQTHHITDVSNAKPDRAKVTVLDGDAVAMLTLGEADDADHLAGVPPFVFTRCPFSEAQIRPLLVDGVAGHSRDALREMAGVRDPALRTQIVETIKSSAPSAE